MKSLDKKVLILWSLPHKIQLYVHLKKENFLSINCYHPLHIYTQSYFFKKGKILSFLFTFECYRYIQCNPSSTSIILNPPLSCLVSINPFFSVSECYLHYTAEKITLIIKLLLPMQENLCIYVSH